MDGLKPGRANYSHRPHARPASLSAKPALTTAKARHSGEKYWLVRSLGKIASKQKTTLWNKFKKSEFATWPDKRLRNRVYALLVLALFIFSTAAAIIQPFIEDKFYGITDAARGVLPEPKTHLGTFLKLDQKGESFLYNEGYNPGSSGANQLSKTGQGEPRITASFGKEPRKGLSVTDTQANVDFKLIPEFKLNVGKQDKNQIFYPLVGMPGYLVYTAQTASVKEDIVLEEAPKEDMLTFEYKLELKDQFEAKLEKNGSVGIYGSSSPITGEVATGNEKDAELLKKARENTLKDKLLFVVPAPVVVGPGKDTSSANSHFELKGDRLKIVTNGLRSAAYPLSIDPSVYVQSAVQLMRGNNETNVEFDVATEQFKKGTTTGARIDSWTETSPMNSAVYDQAMTAANGYVYKAGGKTSRKLPRIISQTVTNSVASSTTININMPADRPNTDLYVIIVGSGGATANSIPSDFTTIRSLSNQVGSYYRYNTGTSIPASYTIPTNLSANAVALVLRIQDFDPASIAGPVSSLGNTTTMPVSYPAFTPSAQGTLTLAAAGVLNAAGTIANKGFSPTTMGDVYGGTSPGGGGGTASLFASAYESPPISGTPIAQQSTNSGVTSGTYTSTMFSINGIAVSNALSNTVEWSQFNSINGAIASPTPGSNGTACTGWCTNSIYDLPTASPSASNGSGLTGMTLTAYNGYLYAIGGYDGSFVKNTIYIAKLGANGEPSLWHPSDANRQNWSYWHKDTGLGTGNERMYHGAYAYNGKMYVTGGRTSSSGSSPGAQSTVFVADILPSGTLGTWASGPTLTNARYGHAIQGYNGYIYVIGGNNGTSIYNTVLYSKVNSDGTLGNWLSAGTGLTSGGTLNQARTSQGGVMAGIWGGYLYVAGGCTSVNTITSGNCTGISSSVELASINADGSLNDWNTILNLRNERFGYSFIAWQDSLYRFGGCARQDSSNGDCYGAHGSVQYGNINQDGDASTVNISQAYQAGASSTNTCSGDDPYNCNLPPGGRNAGQGGQLLTSSVVLNGYLYIIGGCTTYECNLMSDNTMYAAIDSNGKLKSPPTCSGTLVGAWCVDSTNKLTANEGVGAASATIFGGTIYIVGGQNGTSSTNRISRNTVNADGSFAGAWQNQQLSGNTNLNAIGVSYTFAYTRANPTDDTYPGNLYMFGGCTSPATGAGCNPGANYTQNVYKCKISTTGALGTGTNGCTTTGQLPIGTIPGASSPGLGIHAGTVYANYIYLIGGVADGATTADLKYVRYAKFDNNNNVVAASGSTWVQSNVEMNKGRRRGAAFGYNGYIYAVGGYDSNSSAVLDSIEFVKVNVTDGSLISVNPNSATKFEESAVTINQRWGLTMAVSNSYAYVIGGCKLGASPTCDSAGLDPTIQTFQIYNNDSGAPGGFITETDNFALDRVGSSSAIMNGYIYVAGGCIGTQDCNEATNSTQYAPIDAYGNIGAWQAGGNLPTDVSWGQLEAVNGTLYWIAGQLDNGSASSNVYYAQNPVNGNPTWQTSATSIPNNRRRIAATVWNDRIYILGGLSGGGTPTAQNTVHVSSAVPSGGDITSWTALTGFTGDRYGHTAIAYANNLYLIGGRKSDSLYLSDVQYAKINSDGTIGSWSYTRGLPTPVGEADGFAVNGYMYLIGGRTSTNDCAQRTIVAPISANTSIPSGNNPTGIGEWYQTNRKYDGGRYGAAVSYANGKAYVLGGACQGLVMQDNFDNAGPNYYDAGQWSSITNMQANYRCQSSSSSRTLSGTVGGTGASSAVATTKSVDVSSGGTVNFKLYVPLTDVSSPDGTCYSGESPLFGTADSVRLEYCTAACGSWTAISTYTWNASLDPMATLSVTIPTGARTNTTKFRWYITGSDTATDSFALEDVRIIATNSPQISYTGDKRTQYTSLLSQPQVASYSRLIDAGKDVFPSSWLMNGLDNSIGARWQYSYKSMNDPTAASPCGSGAMTGYGQLTAFGNVTLGIPSKYTVKDGSGTDIKCGRYFFSNVFIDASQTYGYPDDISRGPTLDNFTLFFQSNPGQRLIHGKAFIEGSQQPLDTQCRQSNPLVSGNPSASGCLP